MCKAALSVFVLLSTALLFSSPAVSTQNSFARAISDGSPANEPGQCSRLRRKLVVTFSGLEW